ncbi:MAG: 5'-nucleotidase C-terminal domain-containing protein, partial [Ignavibacteria bacterium]
HEHINMLEKVNETIIAKADANVRTVYIHKLSFDINNNLMGIKSDLIDIDSKIAEDSVTKEIVDIWVTRAFKGFYDKGFDPLVMVAEIKEPLDGREISIRYKPTNLGILIANAMLAVSPGSQLAILNSGSVRLDDELYGEITQYDIIRTLPFGGKILQVEMKGSLLLQVLETGKNNEGSGGYLQTANAEYDNTQNTWLVSGKTVESEKVYSIAIADYLMTGMEQNMGFLTKDNPGILQVTEPDKSDQGNLRNDVRLAVIQYLGQKNK